LLPKYGLNTLSDADRDLLVHGWHLLSPWPDAVEGLTQLRHDYIIGPLSNGSVRQLANMAKFGGLPWDVIFGADTFHTYKPAPALYQGAIELIGSPAETILLVAAHNNDLQAAQQQGMRTAFLHRPTEDPAPTGDYDFVASDFLDLASQLKHPSLI
jgi:2-haloacid dehalogenase